MPSKAEKCFGSFEQWWAMADRSDRDQFSALEGFIAAWPVANEQERSDIALDIIPLAQAAGVKLDHRLRKV